MQVPPELPAASPYAAPGAPSSLPPPLPAGSAADWSSLRTLSTVLYLFAALCFVAWAFTALLTGTGAYLESTGQASDTDPVPAFVALGVGLAILTPLLVLLPLSAHRLRRARGRRLGLATAIVSCFACPLGTGVGIAMLVILQRPGVRALFDAQQREPGQ